MDTLILNSDAQPISFLPLSAVSWQEAVKYMILDRVDVLEWYDNWIVSSPSWETRVPAVMMVKDYVKNNREPRFSKYCVLLRDEFVCQYCATDVTRVNGTLDHVIPISRGGKTTWENSVTACRTCNIAKGSSRGWKPIKEPVQPDYWRIVSNVKNIPMHIRHPSWEQYLGVKDVIVTRRSA